MTKETADNDNTRSCVTLILICTTSPLEARFGTLWPFTLPVLKKDLKGRQLSSNEVHIKVMQTKFYRCW